MKSMKYNIGVNNVTFMVTSTHYTIRKESSIKRQSMSEDDVFWKSIIRNHDFISLIYPFAMSVLWNNIPRDIVLIIKIN